MDINVQNTQGEQPKGAPVNPYLVVEAYKSKVDELTHREIMMTAYVRQLEGKVNELQAELEELKGDQPTEE